MTMKNFFARYKQKLQALQGNVVAQFAERNVQRDWYIMLGVSAAALLGLFVVGAYTYFVTIQNTGDNTAVGAVYEEPVTREEILSITEKLHERTQKFKALQTSAPEIPNPGFVHKEEASAPPRGDTRPVVEG